jgi:iron complex outermembrane recepter protein
MYTVRYAKSFAVLIVVGSSVFLQAVASAADSEESSQLETIIVTAQKRSQALQDVPMTVSVVTPDSLEKAQITDTRDLTTLTPGLEMNYYGGYLQPSMRGISGTISSIGADQDVAIYIDGAYQPGQVSNTFDLPDVSQIEVLKGPQGTLFGRNATAGAILVKTLEPSFDWTGFVNGSYGAYNTNGADYNAKAFISGPITRDTLALSVAASEDYDTGYLSDIIHGGNFGEINSSAVRAKLLFQPSSGVSFLLTGFYSSRSDDIAQAGQALNGNTLARRADPTTPLPQTPWQIAFPEAFEPHIMDHSSDVTLRGKFDVGFGTITSFTSYSHQLSFDQGDLELSANSTINNRTYTTYAPLTEEVTLNSSSTGPLTYVAGIFYLTEADRYQNLLGGTNAAVSTDAIAAYGEITYAATSRLTLDAGFRYSSERKVARGANFLPIPTYGDFPADIPLLGEHRWSSPTPKASVRYRLSEDDSISAYFTYSEGFKSGAFNSASLQTTPVAPEKLKSYETGLKIAEHNYSLNLAAFYYDYSDIQTEYFNGVASVVSNAASAKLYGLDLDGSWKIVPSLTVSTSAEWLPHANYVSYPGAITDVPTGLGGNQQIIVDASGLRMIRAPRLTMNLTGAKEWLTNPGTFELSTTVYHSSVFNYNVNADLQSPAYTTVAAQLSFTPTGKPYTVNIWGKNLTNAAYLYGSLPTTISDFVNYAPPRQVGISFRYKF